MLGFPISHRCTDGFLSVFLLAVPVALVFLFQLALEVHP